MPPLKHFWQFNDKKHMASPAPAFEVEAMPALADAADVLSGQLRVQLRRLTAHLRPSATQLESRFISRMKKLGYHRSQWHALASISLGAAARILEKQPPAAFFEQIEYHGRRLAKLNLPPSAIVAALQEYDRLLIPLLESVDAATQANFQWVREQIQFCTILTLNNAYYQVREAETQAFYELFRVEMESRNLDELLHRFLEILVPVTHAAAGHLFLWDEGSPDTTFQAALPKPTVPAPAPSRPFNRKSALRPRCFLITDETAKYLADPSWKGRYASCWSMPLAAGGTQKGLLQFAFGREYDWLPREVELLTAAAERCLKAAEKAKLIEDLAKREEQIRQLAEHMLHVEEIERRRISRELHDEAGQSLLYIRLQMEMIEQAIPDEMAELRQKLGETRDVTEHTILEIRRLIAALSPAVLEQLGLAAALRQLLNRFRRMHACKVKLNLPRRLDLPKKTESIVYRLVQECCNNIGKHSAASRVNISLTSADGMLRLHVEDNGVGFSVEEAFAKRDSFGLSGMRERVALMGGRFTVHSRAASSSEQDTQKAAAKGTRSRHGTEIQIELPIPVEPVTA